MIFNAHDVIQFAIRIEEDGEQFYKQAARRIGNEEAKNLFLRLADDEVGHKTVFSGMLNGLADYRPPETYEGEYMAYLRNYIDGKAVFTGGNVPEGFDTVAAFDFAIQRETDSILYYQELKAFLPQQHYRTVDAIINEERKHFSTLSEAKKSYVK